MAPCTHDTLIYTLSSNARDVGFRRPGPAQRTAAAQVPGSGRRRAAAQPTEPTPSTFPAPLVLPDDALARAPNTPAQSLQQWINDPDRTPLTAQRRTIYVVPPFSISNECAFMRSWKTPILEPGTSQSTLDMPAVPKPRMDDVFEYLRDFYHPIPVRLLTGVRPRFVTWVDNSRPRTRQQSRRLNLRFYGHNGRDHHIRWRAGKDGRYAGQLNMHDLRDAGDDLLPNDAHSLIFILEQDMYEDDEDDYNSGRSFRENHGRVAMVSLARYHPKLDEFDKVHPAHAWPASHCREYVRKRCRGEDDDNDDDNESEDEAPARKRARPGSSVLKEAVSAWNSLPKPTTRGQLQTQWLGRVALTASHEMGHNLGLDHCAWYACYMQGVANMGEDARQPPYACPVDMAKILRASGGRERAWLNRMLRFCNRFSNDRFFATFGAWLTGRLREIR